MVLLIGFLNLACSISIQISEFPLILTSLFTVNNTKGYQVKMVIKAQKEDFQFCKLYSDSQSVKCNYAAEKNI